MATLNDLFIKALALIDELLPSGAYDPSKVADYKGKTPAIADMLQKELLKTGDLYKIFELSRSPIPSMYGIISGFDIQEYKGIPLTFEAVNDAYGGIKAYYFETDGAGTVYVEDYNGTWNTLATITTTATQGFAGYKGLVTPTPGATKSRLRFTGSYYYRTVNRALFNYPLPSAIDYMPWLRVDLPTDVKSIDQVITEYPDRQYSKDTMYKIEWSGHRQQLYINYYYVGKIRVQYKPIPTTLTSLSDTLEIDEITSQLIAYGLAYNFMLAENNEYAAKELRDKYNLLKLENTVKQPVTISSIIDVYGAVF